jgi:hypothetical protein
MLGKATRCECADRGGVASGLTVVAGCLTFAVVNAPYEPAPLPERSIADTVVVGRASAG